MNQFVNPMMQQQNPYFMQRQNPYFQPQQQNNGITWVQGIEGAKAWQLSPNSNAILMDSENDGRFYIKISDNVGMCTLRIFDYKEVTTNQPVAQPQIDLSEYVKKSELEALINSMLGGTNNEQSVSTTNAKPTITK